MSDSDEARKPVESPEGQPAAEPVEKKPEPPAKPPVTRRTIPVPGGSCNVRMGHGALDSLGPALTASVGTARRALLVSGDDVPAETVELVRRQLTDVGFKPILETLPIGDAVRALPTAGALFAELADAGLTSDDAVVGVGGADVLSLCAFVSGLWCGGMTCAFVPLDPNAAVEACVTPRGIDSAGIPNAIACPGRPRVVVLDLDLIGFDDSELSLLARVRMVAAAVGDGEKALANLSERAEAIAAHDADATGTQILDTLRSLGRLACSNAAAVRQALLYGTVIANALDALVPELTPSQALAEALRFSARLVVGVDEGADVDFVFEQDALLTNLGIAEVGYDIDPNELVSALKRVCFATSNRFMLALPKAIGKVRLMVVPDEVLAEHAGAWCSSRAKLLARQQQG
jgi:3-dehydroquinate synthetase